MQRFLIAIVAIVGAWATLGALLTTVTLLAPGLCARVAGAERKMPVRSFVLGTVNFLFFFAVVAVLAQIGDSISGAIGGFFTLLALIIALLILSLMSVGLAGMVTILSERLGTGATAGNSLRASLLLVAAGLAPLVGWFVLTPLALLTALGAAITAIIQLANRKLSGEE